MPLYSVLGQPGTTKAYSIDRDLAYCAGSLFDETVRRFATWGSAGGAVWPELREIARRLGASPADVGQALDAFSRFVNEIGDHNEGVPDALLRTGWFACAPEAQAVVLAMFGTVVTGAIYVGIRESTFGNEGPTQGMAHLVRAAARVANGMITRHVPIAVAPSAAGPAAGPSPG